MRTVILAVLILMVVGFVLEHSFFVMRTGTVLVGLAVVGCVLYGLIRIR
jgi:hypothetical protein